MLKTVCWRTYEKWNIGPMIKLHFPTWEAECDHAGKRNVVSHTCPIWCGVRKVGALVGVTELKSGS
jgi:hypothetical protein